MLIVNAESIYSECCVSECDYADSYFCLVTCFYCCAGCSYAHCICANYQCAESQCRVLSFY
jgi:hypothetical protein